MAERRDDVLSLCGSDQEGSAMSDFSGFEPEEVSGNRQNLLVSSLPENKNGDAVSSANKKIKRGSKGPGKTKPSESKKGKGKMSKSKDKPSSSSAKSVATSSKQNKDSTSIYGVENLTSEEISQLREILGFNNQPHEDEGLSVFDLYGPKPGNLTIECDNDPSSDVEIVPHGPVRTLDKQLKEALFDNLSDSKENEEVALQDDDISWQLPKLKAPKKGDAVSSSLAKMINTACTSQCELDEILSKYKIPSNCDKMGAPTVNPEIWADIVRKAQSYDKAFQDIQTLIASGIVPIIKLVSIMKSKVSDEAKSYISDAITLLGQAQFNISLRRRYMIRPFLKKKYSSLCNIATPITNQLFGDDLNKEIKKCDTSVSVARDQYGYLPNYRGQSRGRARGRGYSYPYRGYSNSTQGYGSQYGGQQYGGRGYARYHPYVRQQSQFRQFQQYQAPKKGQKTATVTNPNDTAV